MIKAPLRATIQITDACNQSCSYCYNPVHASAMMQWDDFRNIADILTKLGVFKIALAGGEPFIHPQFFDMYRYLSKRAFLPPIVLTNGSITSPTIRNEIESLIDAGPLRIQVSLDAMHPITGLQDRRIADTISFIDFLISQGAQVSIGCVITSLNIAMAPDIVRHFRERVTAYHFMPAMPVTNHRQWILANSPNEQQKLAFQLKIEELSEKYCVTIAGGYSDAEYETFPSSGCHTCTGCAAGYTKCLIDPNLNIFACEITLDLVLGNLNDHSFEDIWHSAVSQRVREADFPLCHFPDRLQDLISLTEPKRRLPNESGTVFR